MGAVARWGSKTHPCLPWHSSPGQLCISCELFSLLPILSFSAAAGTGGSWQQWVQGSLGGLWAAPAPCRLSSLEVLQGSQTVAPFLSCVTACIVFLGTTNP